MKMSYNKLWKLLIDKQMKKSDLRKKAGCSFYRFYTLCACDTAKRDSGRHTLSRFVLCDTLPLIFKDYIMDLLARPNAGPKPIGSSTKSCM